MKQLLGTGYTGELEKEKKPVWTLVFCLQIEHNVRIGSQGFQIQNPN